VCSLDGAELGELACRNGVDGDRRTSPVPVSTSHTTFSETKMLGVPRRGPGAWRALLAIDSQRGGVPFFFFAPTVTVRVLDGATTATLCCAELEPLLLAAVRVTL